MLRVWPGGLDRAGRCGALEGGGGGCLLEAVRTRLAGELGLSPRPLLEGAGRVSPRGAGGRGSLCFVCDPGGASALSRLPGGAAVVGRGFRQPGEP